jgi:N-acetyl-alpha-D-glucosaminyl L-malate synthase BshA
VSGSLSIAVLCFSTLGGSGVVASELGALLAARGHHVRFIGAEPPPRFHASAPRVSFHRVPATAPPPVESSAYAFELAAAIVEAARDVDVIHAHYAVPHAAAAVVARAILRDGGARLPRLVTTLHGTDVTAFGVDPRWRPVVRHAVARSDAITVPSSFLRAEAVRHLGLREDGVRVIPNFVDPDVYRPREGHLGELFPALGSFDDAARRPRVLFHGSSFRALKRVGDAVLALASLRRQGLPTALALLGDGPERAAVEARVADLGLESSVRFLGARGHFEDLLSRADVFLLPSETESFGLAALEALASGVPVVASAVGGLPEVVRDGETGLLVPPADPEALARAVRALLHDETRRRAMSERARADAVARFAPKPAVDRYEEVLRGDA